MNLHLILMSALGKFRCARSLSDPRPIIGLRGLTKFAGLLEKVKSSVNDDEWDFFCSKVSDSFDSSFQNGIFAANQSPLL